MVVTRAEGMANGTAETGRGERVTVAGGRSWGFCSSGAVRLVLWGRPRSVSIAGRAAVGEPNGPLRPSVPVHEPVVPDGTSLDGPHRAHRRFTFGREDPLIAEPAGWPGPGDTTGVSTP